jgi:hypothetical protein
MELFGVFIALGSIFIFFAEDNFKPQPSLSKGIYLVLLFIGIWIAYLPFTYPPVYTEESLGVNETYLLQRKFRETIKVQVQGNIFKVIKKKINYPYSIEDDVNYFEFYLNDQAELASPVLVIK